MKRCAELRDLSDDHHLALVLAKNTKQACSGDVQALWRRVRDDFDSQLARHFGIEEKHLFPLVEQAGGGHLTRRALDDHAALRAYVLNGPRDSETLRAFGTCLHDHVRFEERVLFPFAEENLTASELTGVMLAGRKSVSQDQT